MFDFLKSSINNADFFKNNFYKRNIIFDGRNTEMMIDDYGKYLLLIQFEKRTKKAYKVVAFLNKQSLNRYVISLLKKYINLHFVELPLTKKRQLDNNFIRDYKAGKVEKVFL